MLAPNLIGIRLRSFLPALLLLFACVAPASADGEGEPADRCEYLEILPENWTCWWFVANAFRFRPFDENPAAAARFEPGSATYLNSNRGATLEKGEPTVGGLMKKTIWGTHTATANGRIVFHTFGSDIDTVLALYEADPPREPVAKLKALGANDDTAVPEYAKTTSLVAIDVVKGRSYRVQIGGKRGAEGDVALTSAFLPPGGGISAFLIDLGGNPQYHDRDYGCTFRPCGSARFVVHNSTAKSVTVTPSVTPTELFTPPAPVTLKPGAVAVVEFVGTPGANPAAGRFSQIVFRFPAKAGVAAVPALEARGFLFQVALAGVTDKLRLSIDDRLKVGSVNQPQVFTARLTNTGADVARGCHFRGLNAPANAPDMLTQFMRIDPSTAKALAGINTATDILPGQTHVYAVQVRSQRSHRADLEFGLNSAINARCLNRQTPATDYTNTFDLNASATQLFTQVTAKLAPKRAVISVPKGGSASFDVVAVNGKRSLPLTAAGRFRYPPSEYNPDAQYDITVCRLTPKGKCVVPANYSANWTPKPGEKAKFRFFVKAPKVDPGFDPKKYRIFVEIAGTDRSRPNLFGSADVAVRRK